jgi:hypothetical protein
VVNWTEGGNYFVEGIKLIKKIYLYRAEQGIKVEGK